MRVAVGPAAVADGGAAADGVVLCEVVDMHDEVGGVERRVGEVG